MHRGKLSVVRPCYSFLDSGNIDKYHNNHFPKELTHLIGKYLHWELLWQKIHTHTRCTRCSKRRSLLCNCVIRVREPLLMNRNQWYSSWCWSTLLIDWLILSPFQMSNLTPAEQRYRTILDHYLEVIWELPYVPPACLHQLGFIFAWGIFREKKKITLNW